MKATAFRLVLIAGAMIAAENMAESRSLSPARNNVCAPLYCSAQWHVCAEACGITTTNSANRDHTFQLCQNFCRREDDDCLAYECRVTRHPR